MNSKYIIILLIAFGVINILFMYLLISNQWAYFLNQLKWFLRMAAPFLIIYFLYLGTKK